MIQNRPEQFGYQLIINENEEIIKEEEKWLNQACGYSIDDCIDIIHDYQGIAVPAHIDKKRFSLFSQLGFLPSELKADGLEVFFKENLYKYPEKYGVIQSSDAHSIELVGTKFCNLICEKPDFFELVKCLKKEEGRRIEYP